MKVNELIETIGSIRKEANQKYKEYKDAQVTLAELKEQLYSALNEAGLKSAKAQNFGVSIRESLSIEVQSEQAVIDWLENTPDVESDAYVGLKVTAFKKFAQEWFKQTGEIIDGTDSFIKETLTITENKRK